MERKKEHKMKKKIGLTALAVIVCIVCVLAYNFGTSNKSTKDVAKNKIDRYVKVQKYNKDKKLYQYTLYNLKGEKVYEEKNLSSEPSVKQLKSGIIKVIIPAGTGVSQTRYYDYKTEKISEIFNTPWDERENKLIRFENNKAIVQNMFDEKLYQEIKLDMKNVADPNSAVKEAGFVENNKVKIVYTSSDNDEEKTKTIEIKNNSETESNSTHRKSNTNTIQNKEILEVLKKNRKYYNTELKKECYIKDYNSGNYIVFSDNGKYEYTRGGTIEKIQVDSWCQIDMDLDGKKEVVLQTNSEKVLVLISKNGKVYCYAFPFRGLKNIKTDGTFESSGSAADTYIGRLRFEKGGCAYSEICAIDAQNVGSQIYRVNGENTTKTKAEAFLKKQEKKKNVTWHQQNPISK